MRCDKGLDLWVRFEEGCMGTPPKFRMMRLKSLNYIVRGSKASKGTHLRSRVWFWKCLVKDACKTSKLINKLKNKSGLVV